MDSNWNEWLNLVVRWIHVLFGIIWIGTSIFFNWLDSSFEPLEKEEEGVIGESWMVHGGGFYHVKKKNLKPSEIPKTLHWFKWEAGFTWISGITLLTIVYYLGGGAFLVDPEVSDVSVNQAITIGIASLIAGWVIYDNLWMSSLAKNHKNLTIGLCLLLLIVFAYRLTGVFSGRAAYIHIGAMLGTIMAGNVWFRILPAQSQMLEATRNGEKADLTLGARARMRSGHNNYMTFPVVFIMLSNHFPSTYGSNFNWLILIILIVASAVIKHIMNLNENFKFWGFPSIVIGTAAIIALMFITSIPKAPEATENTNNASVKPVSFTEVRAVINQRCVVCHSAKPTDNIFKVAPNGIKFDTPEKIKAMIPRIKFRAVVSKTMPFGNKTKMTETERTLLGNWIAQGASIEK